MVQMAVLGKNYQRDTVVDQEQLYHVWMPHGIQLDVTTGFFGWGVAGYSGIFSSDLSCWLKVLDINGRV